MNQDLRIAVVGAGLIGRQHAQRAMDHPRMELDCVVDPLLQPAAEAVASGAIGDPVAVTGPALFYKPDEHFDAAPWRRIAGTRGSVSVPALPMRTYEGKASWWEPFTATTLPIQPIEVPTGLTVGPLPP
jgi:predicted dehydrogenase